MARALCHTRNEDVTVPWLDHRLYVVPTGGGVANAPLLQNVYDYLTEQPPDGKPRDALAGLHPVSAVYAPQTIAATLKTREGFDPANTNTLRNAAIVLLQAMFDPQMLDPKEPTKFLLQFGAPVPRSVLITALQQLPDVKSVTLTLPATDAAIAANAFPSLSGTPAITISIPS